MVWSFAIGQTQKTLTTFSDEKQNVKMHNQCYVSTCLKLFLQEFISKFVAEAFDSYKNRN